MQDNVFKIIDDLENNDLVKRIKEIKKEIKSDSNILSMIKKYNAAKELYEKYNDKLSFVKEKENIMNNKLIKEYISIQNEINILALHINNRIKEITSIGGQNESNKW